MFPVVKERVPLAPLTTFGIGGVARFYAEPDTPEACRALYAWACGAGVGVWLLGGGSNLLVADEGVDGLVLRLGRGGRFGAIERDADDPARLTVGGGVALARLVGTAAGWGLSGLEEWAAIPGTVGGAVAMNAGGRVGLCETAEAVETLAPDGTLRRWRRGESRPSYRDGGFGDSLVMRAVFRLLPKTVAEVREATARAARRKAEIQPLSAASAGCVFRNPPEGPSAGQLIDRAGLKGLRTGGAMVSEKHANFIVNVGGATAGEVTVLAGRVMATVRELFSVALTPEIRRWP